MKELQRQASPNIVIALAGNKADLANKRMVDAEVRKEINSFVIGFSTYINVYILCKLLNLCDFINNINKTDLESDRKVITNLRSCKFLG